MRGQRDGRYSLASRLWKQPVVLPPASVLTLSGAGVEKHPDRAFLPSELSPARLTVDVMDPEQHIAIIEIARDLHRTFVKLDQLANRLRDKEESETLHKAAQGIVSAELALHRWLDEHAASLT